MNKEIRAFNFEIRANENEERGQYIEGRATVFNERTDLGWYDEIIDSGALKDTDLRDVRLLVNHNVDMIPLARSRNNTENSTLKLSVVEDEGLDIRANLDTDNNADAKSLYSAIDRGDISGMSFMFAVNEDAWEDIDTDHPTRHIRSIAKVFEVSAVTFPAYEQTSIATRGLSSALDSARESLENEKAKRNAIERKKKKIKILTEVNNGF